MDLERTPMASLLRRLASKPGDRGEISATYQLFTILLTLDALVVALAYYLLPAPKEVKEVLYILDSLNAFLLLADFFYRLHRSPNRPRYFATFGWLDLIGALPGLPLLRLARIPTLRHLSQWLNREAPAEVRKDAASSLASSTLLTTILVVLVVITFGSIFIVLVEKNAPNGNIQTGEDAIWWSIVTIATVGYGDRFPTTALGRLIGTAMIVVGVSLFSVLTSFIATTFVARRRSAEQSHETAALREQIEQMFAWQQQSAESEAEALRREVLQLRGLLEEVRAIVRASNEQR